MATYKAGTSGTGSGSVTLTIPSSTTPGDLLLIFAGVNSEVDPFAVPTGWTLVDSEIDGTMTGAAMYRVAQSGDAGADVVIDTTAAGGIFEKIAAVLVVYTAVDGADPVPTFAVAVETAVNAGVGTSVHAAPEVTLAADALVIQAVLDKASQTTSWIRIPAGTVRRQEAYHGTPGSPSACVADSAGHEAAGTAGGGSWESNWSTANAVMFTVALAPAAASSAAPPGYVEVRLFARDDADTAPPEVTVPSAPRDVQATAETSGARITWSAPSSTGGTPITGYRITRSGSSTQQEVSASARSYTWNDLPSTAITFTVYALNAVGASSGATSNAVAPTPPATPTTSDYLFISSSELASLPASGSAWNFLVSAASSPPAIDLSNQNTKASSQTLAAALQYKRTGGGIGRDAIISRLRAGMGTEDGTAQPLNAYRQMPGMWLAMDLVDMDPTLTGTRSGYTSTQAQQWVFASMTKQQSGHTQIWGNVMQAAEVSPNNWGVFARCAAVIGGLWLVKVGHRTAESQAMLDDAIGYFKRWIGEDLASNPNTFVPTDQDDFGWAIDNYPSGQGVINRHVEGDDRSGINVSDVGRGVTGTAAVPYANYDGNWDGRTDGNAYQMECWTAWTATCVALWHAGYTDVFSWGNEALRRNMAAVQLHGGFNNPYGDVLPNPHLVNHVYGTAFPESTSEGYGRVWSAGQWLTAPGSTWLL